MDLIGAVSQFLGAGAQGSFTSRAFLLNWASGAARFLVHCMHAFAAQQYSMCICATAAAALAASNAVLYKSFSLLCRLVIWPASNVDSCSHLQSVLLRTSASAVSCLFTACSTCLFLCLACLLACIHCGYLHGTLHGWWQCVISCLLHSPLARKLVFMELQHVVFLTLSAQSRLPYFLLVVA